MITVTVINNMIELEGEKAVIKNAVKTPWIEMSHAYTLQGSAGRLIYQLFQKERCGRFIMSRHSHVIFAAFLLPEKPTREPTCPSFFFCKNIDLFLHDSSQYKVKETRLGAVLHVYPGIVGKIEQRPKSRTKIRTLQAKNNNNL